MMNHPSHNDDSTVTTAASSFVQIGNEPSLVNTTLGGQPLSLKIEPRHGTIGLDAIDPTTQRKFSTVHVCASVQAQDLRDDDDDEGDRAAVDIVFAADLSGSMSGSKLRFLKDSLKKSVRFLGPQDRWGLIGFSSDARIILPIQRMTPEYKEKCFKTIDALHATGGTNISAAIGLAAQEIRTVETPNAVRSIFLLTDGHANEGICDMSGLIRLCRNCLVGPSTELPQEIEIEPCRRGFMGFNLRSSSNRRGPPPARAPSNETAAAEQPPQVRFADYSKALIPISLHAFGYGSDHNESLLQEMANVTEGGSYYFVGDDKSVSLAFGDALGGIVSVVAQNTVLQLQLPAQAAAMGVKIDKVHHDQVITRENGTYTVTLGDFYAEEGRDVVLSVQLAVPREEGTASPIPHVVANLCYTDTLQRRPVESGSATASIARPSGQMLSEENAHVTAQWLRVFGVEQMLKAEAHANSSNFEEASACLDYVNTIYHAQSPSVQAHRGSAGVFQSSMAMQQDFSMGASNYRAFGSKRSKQSIQLHRTQRACVETPRATAAATTESAALAPISAEAAYVTKSKTSWRQKFNT